jgi:hypothetical protein
VQLFFGQAVDKMWWWCQLEQPKGIHESLAFWLQMQYPPKVLQMKGL